MTFKTLAAAACISFAGASTAVAGMIDFTFSFRDGATEITGLIEGLKSGVGGPQQAERITVKGVFDTYLFDDASTFGNNRFFVVGTDIGSESLFNFSAPPLITGIANTGSASFLELFNGLSEFQEFDGAPPIRPSIFSRVSASATQLGPAVSYSPVPVPLPPGVLLLISGLAGVAVFNRRKKRAA